MRAHPQARLRMRPCFDLYTAFSRSEMERSGIELAWRAQAGEPATARIALAWRTKARECGPGRIKPSLHGP